MFGLRNANSGTSGSRVLYGVGTVATVETSSFSFLGSAASTDYPSVQTYGVYRFPLFSQGNVGHHSFLLLCHWGSDDRPKEEGSRWWCILLSSLVK